LQDKKWEANEPADTALDGRTAWTGDARSAICAASARRGAPSGRASVFANRRVGTPGYREGPEEGLVIVQIFVRDNNVDQALKALKKKMQREGTFREMKRHVHYEKPSEKRARQKAEAVRRARKLARKRMQREGLLPPPKPKVRK
jgi:small subunit ribosomal protein S21